MAARFEAVTRQSLLLRIKDLKDQAAWREFVDIYSPWIHAYCLALPGMSEDAADLTQEILVKLTRAMPDFDYDPNERFRGWLHRVMQNSARDYWRKIKARPDRKGGLNVNRLDPEDKRATALVAANALDDELVKRLAGHYLDRAEDMLAKEQRDSQSWRTFRTMYEAELTVDEAAKKWGVSKATIAMRRMRVREWLRALGLDSPMAMEEQGGDV